MQDNNLVQQMFTQINNLIDYKMSQQTAVKSAMVHSVNQDGTVDIIIPPSNSVYHNIQNQSVYRNLKPGDNVKIIIENGNLSSMWIIGGFKQNGVSPLDSCYPVGSVYLATNDINPSELLGGLWQQMNGTLPLIYNLSNNDNVTEKDIQNLMIYVWQRVK